MASGPTEALANTILTTAARDVASQAMPSHPPPSLSSSPSSSSSTTPTVASFIPANTIRISRDIIKNFGCYEAPLNLQGNSSSNSCYYYNNSNNNNSNKRRTQSFASDASSRTAVAGVDNSSCTMAPCPRDLKGIIPIIGRKSPKSLVPLTGDGDYSAAVNKWSDRRGSSGSLTTIRVSFEQAQLLHHLGLSEGDCVTTYVRELVDSSGDQVDIRLFTSMVDAPYGGHSVNKRFVGLYFCDAYEDECHRFKPTLNKFSRDFGRAFTVVYVSMDADQDTMMSYIRSTNWLALPFEDQTRRTLLAEELQVQHVPTLIVFDAVRLRVVTKLGKDEIANDETRVTCIEDWIHKSETRRVSACGALWPPAISEAGPPNNPRRAKVVPHNESCYRAQSSGRSTAPAARRAPTGRLSQNLAKRMSFWKNIKNSLTSSQ